MIRLAKKEEQNGLFKPVLKAAEKAFKYLHKQGGYKVGDLNAKPYQDLIRETANVFDMAIADNVVSEELRRALQSDAFHFGTIKAHAELFDASLYLLDENGHVKPLSQLKHQFDRLNIQYNEQYLDAEYQFAINSALSADQWSRLGEDNEIQYRTAGDEHVRKQHAELNRITLPKSSPFWLKWWPPNGWGCRCRAIEVLKGKYPLSNEADAISKGEEATTQIGKDGTNRMAIFQFNPGLSLKLMPPEHPYNKVKDADKIEVRNEKPFILDKASGERLIGRGFTIDLNEPATEFFNKNFAGFNFEELDDEIQALANDHGLTFKNKEITQLSSRHIQLVYEANRNKFTLYRDLFIKDDLKTVEHYYFKISEDLQGTGISKRLFNALYTQYQNAGIQSISVHANINIGGYTWGKYGFSAYKSQDVETLYERASALLKNGTLTDRNFEHFDGLYNYYKTNGGNFNMHDVANTGYGKKLLLGTDWYGKIDLRDEEQRNIFENYLKGK